MQRAKGVENEGKHRVDHARSGKGGKPRYGCPIGSCHRRESCPSDGHLASHTVIFHADHPFLYLIRDTNADVILFVGRVVTAEEPQSTSRR